MGIITSLQNNSIKQAQGLREARARREIGMTIIDGVREIKRALAAGIPLVKAFYVKGQQDALVKQLVFQKVETIEVNDKVMEKLAYGERHEGVVALATIPKIGLADLKLSVKPLVVVVESLEKPGNLGAILRTCDAVGVEAVLVCDPKTDIYNPNVIRASTGTIFSVPVICENREKILSFLKDHRFKLCALHPEAQKLYSQVDFKGPSAFVLGAEYQGLSDFWLQSADTSVRIPMKGVADSLNVSISAAVILYEALRQRCA